MPLATHNHLPALRRLLGIVTSTGMDRTAVVAIPRLYVHPLTRRLMKKNTVYFCHDAHEVCGVGDKVQIKFCGKVSKKKSHTVIDMVLRHPRLEGEPFQMSRLKTPPTRAEVEALNAAKVAELEIKAAKAAAKALEQQQMR
jgi:small subunit ribosomal protein S17